MAVRRQRRASRCAVAALLLAVSCVAPGRPPKNLPPLPSTMDVTMREYRFDHPPQVPAGRVVFRVHNAGSLTHELILVAVPEDVPPIDQQLKSDTRVGVDTIATLRDRAPGSNGTFAADLTPGRYAFVCFLMDPDGVSHALKGMASQFRVP